MDEIKELDSLKDEMNEIRDIQTEIAKIDEIKAQIMALSIPISQCPPTGPVRTQPPFPVPPNAMIRRSGQNSIQRDDVDFCEACERLDEADNLLVNGMTASECYALFNNRGLDINSAQTNCETLQDLVDCLIGQHKKKLDITNFCDIKDWLEEMMANIWNVKSALVCDSCGQWEQIRLLWVQIREIWEQIVAIWAELVRIKAELLARIECVRSELHERITEEVRLLNERIDREIQTINNRFANNERILTAILEQLRHVGVWGGSNLPSTAPINLNGSPNTGINLAAGNINLFGNASGSRFIRTNQITNNPQDIRGGLS